MPGTGRLGGGVRTSVKGCFVQATLGHIYCGTRKCSLKRWNLPARLCQCSPFPPKTPVLCVVCKYHYRRYLIHHLWIKIMVLITTINWTLIMCVVWGALDRLSNLMFRAFRGKYSFLWWGNRSREASGHVGKFKPSFLWSQDHFNHHDIPSERWMYGTLQSGAETLLSKVT